MKKLIVTTKWAEKLKQEWLTSNTGRFTASWEGRWTFYLLSLAPASPARVFIGWFVFDMELQRYEFVFSSSVENYGFSTNEFRDLAALCDKCCRKLPKLTTI